MYKINYKTNEGGIGIFLSESTNATAAKICDIARQHQTATVYKNGKIIEHLLQPPQFQNLVPQTA